MKTKLFIIVIILFGFNFLSAQVPSYVPTNGLIAYWPFTGNAIDASGNNHNGTVNGPTLAADRFGNSNSAYNFNGTSDFISVPASTMFTQKPMSFSFWFKQTGAGNKCQIYTTSTNIFSVGNFGDSFDVQLDKPTNKIGIVRSIPSNPNNENGLYLIKEYNLNQWNQAVVIYNTNSVTVYLNGVLIGDLNYTTQSTIANTTCFIGKSNPTIWACVNYMNGLIDDFAVYNRILSPDEVSSLFNGGLCYQNITVTDTLVINTGVLGYNPVTYNNTITIYPNPTKDHVTIDCGTLTNVVGYHIEISNTLGQILFNQPMNTQQYNVALNSWTGNGVYFVKVFDAQNNELTTRKIILQ
jgi:hypothetical protein